MDCRKIHVQLHWIRCAAMDARSRLDDGDNHGVEAALFVAEQAIIEIRNELKGATR